MVIKLGEKIMKPRNIPNDPMCDGCTTECCTACSKNVKDIFRAVEILKARKRNKQTLEKITKEAVHGL